MLFQETSLTAENAKTEDFMCNHASSTKGIRGNAPGKVYSTPSSTIVKNVYAWPYLRHSRHDSTPWNGGRIFSNWGGKSSCLFQPFCHWPDAPEGRSYGRAANCLPVYLYGHTVAGQLLPDSFWYKHQPGGTGGWVKCHVAVCGSHPTSMNPSRQCPILSRPHLDLSS